MHITCYNRIKKPLVEVNKIKIVEISNLKLVAYE